MDSVRLVTAIVLSLSTIALAMLSALLASNGEWRSAAVLAGASLAAASLAGLVGYAAERAAARERAAAGITS